MSGEQSGEVDEGRQQEGRYCCRGCGWEPHSAVPNWQQAERHARKTDHEVVYVEPEKDGTGRTTLRCKLLGHRTRVVDEEGVGPPVGKCGRRGCEYRQELPEGWDGGGTDA